VCSNNTQLFELVLSYTSSIESEVHRRHSTISGLIAGGASSGFSLFRCDDYGNNALHLCVLHNLRDMYTYVVNAAKASIRRELKIAFATAYRQSGGRPSTSQVLDLKKVRRRKTTNCYSPKETAVCMCEEHHFNMWLDEHTNKKLCERLLWVLNVDFHSPLTLAAASLVAANNISGPDLDLNFEQSRVDMLGFMIGEFKETRWTYGPVTCSILKLEVRLLSLFV
jgi:hypothetical protein